MGRKWTTEYIEGAFRDEVREKLKKQGKNPNVKPTYAWLRKHGYMGIRGYADRHNMTIDQVLVHVAGFEPRETYALPGHHGETISLVGQWLEDHEKVFGKIDDIDQLEVEIKRVMELAQESLGSVNLLRFGREPREVAARNVQELFSQFTQEIEGKRTRYSYAQTLIRFLKYAELLGVIHGHPVDEELERTGWGGTSTKPTPTLDTEDIRQCWDAAETTSQRVLLALLAFGGVRPSKAMEVHADDFFLEMADPRVAVASKRAGENEAHAIMAGRRCIKKYLAQLEEEVDEWNGALFPSDISADGTRSSAWLLKQIAEVVERAGITLDDESQPTPKDFYRFWHASYDGAFERYKDRIDEIADQQGSDDTMIVIKHYLPDRHRRDHHRRHGEEYFQAACPDEEYVSPDEVFGARDEDIQPD